MSSTKHGRELTVTTSRGTRSTPLARVKAVQIDRIDGRVAAFRMAPDYSDGALGPFLFRFQQPATCHNYIKRALKPVPAATANLLGTHVSFLATYEKACERLRVPIEQREGVRRVLAMYGGTDGPAASDGVFTVDAAVHGSSVADPDVARRDASALVATHVWRPRRWVGWDRRWAVLMRHAPASATAATDDGSVVYLFKSRESLKAVEAIAVTAQETCACTPWCVAMVASRASPCPARAGGRVCACTDTALVILPCTGRRAHVHTQFSSTLSARCTTGRPSAPFA